jgi:hypothetical protein
MENRHQRKPGEFAYNRKSHILSAMMVKPTLENSMDEIKARTL